MTRARASHWLAFVLGAVDIFHRKRFGPVFPVVITEDDGDGRSDGLRVADAGDDLHLILFDFHAPAASIALLAAP